MELTPTVLALYLIRPYAGTGNVWTFGLLCFALGTSEFQAGGIPGHVFPPQTWVVEKTRTNHALDGVYASRWAILYGTACLSRVYRGYCCSRHCSILCWAPLGFVVLCDRR